MKLMLNKITRAFSNGSTWAWVEENANGYQWQDTQDTLEVP